MCFGTSRVWPNDHGSLVDPARLRAPGEVAWVDDAGRVLHHPRRPLDVKSDASRVTRER